MPDTAREGLDGRAAFFLPFARRRARSSPEAGASRSHHFFPFALAQRAWTARRAASRRSVFVDRLCLTSAARRASADRSSGLSAAMRDTPPRRPHRERSFCVRTSLSVAWPGTY